MIKLLCGLQDHSGLDIERNSGLVWSRKLLKHSLDHVKIQVGRAWYCLIASTGLAEISSGRDDRMSLRKRHYAGKVGRLVGIRMTRYEASEKRGRAHRGSLELSGGGLVAEKYQTQFSLGVTRCMMRLRGFRGRVVPIWFMRRSVVMPGYADALHCLGRNDERPGRRPSGMLGG